MRSTVSRRKIRTERLMKNCLTQEKVDKFKKEGKCSIGRKKKQDIKRTKPVISNDIEANL
jgi:hypothetical protein